MTFDDALATILEGAASGVGRTLAGKAVDWLKEWHEGRRPTALPPPRARRSRDSSRGRSALALRNRDGK